MGFVHEQNGAQTACRVPDLLSRHFRFLTSSAPHPQVCGNRINYEFALLVQSLFFFRKEMTPRRGGGDHLHASPSASQQAPGAILTYSLLVYKSAMTHVRALGLHLAAGRFCASPTLSILTQGNLHWSVNFSLHTVTVNDCKAGSSQQPLKTLPVDQTRVLTGESCHSAAVGPWLVCGNIEVFMPSSRCDPQDLGHRDYSAPISIFRLSASPSC